MFFNPWFLETFLPFHRNNQAESKQKTNFYLMQCVDQQHAVISKSNAEDEPQVAVQVEYWASCSDLASIRKFCL